MVTGLTLISTPFFAHSNLNRICSSVSILIKESNAIEYAISNASSCETETSGITPTPSQSVPVCGLMLYPSGIASLICKSGNAWSCVLCAAPAVVSPIIVARLRCFSEYANASAAEPVLKLVNKYKGVSSILLPVTSSSVLH